MCYTREPSRFGSSKYRCTKCQEQVKVILDKKNNKESIKKTLVVKKKVNRLTVASATAKTVKKTPIVKQGRGAVKLLLREAFKRHLLQKSTKFGRFDLKEKHVNNMIQAQYKLCSILKVPLRLFTKTNFKLSLDRINDSITYTKPNTRITCLEVNTRSKWRFPDPAVLIENFLFGSKLTNGKLDTLFHSHAIGEAIKFVLHSAKCNTRNKAVGRRLFGKYEINYNFMVLLYFFQGGRSWYTRAILGVPPREQSIRDHPSSLSPERLDVLTSYTLENTVLIDSRTQSTNNRAAYKNPEDFTFGDGNWSKLKFYFMIYCQECFQAKPNRIHPKYYEDWLKDNEELQIKVAKEELERLEFVRFARSLLNRIDQKEITLEQAVLMVKRNRYH
ncbi:hypothetical protein DFA_12363 [Cavenderia fasciculata]|uniref:Uncharacterized protein n=1 Tax=Cavenderia fasciculata TaxID=261658 RepID=F4QDG8_CACFS|nr:uncharacterized protein DFA_12363 [Cavenderia fasciculata]EGG14586.1 hypothetical protein DFA_12363 [Cavenderia fasciculata]|eukprot:XP_004366106.1 hypothetical protein DFA_12363 [Cavenderia fasciculata]